jgi:hypothetical protein
MLKELIIDYKKKECSHMNDRESRDQQKDLVEAINCLYVYKVFLSTLHPSVESIIEGLLKATY